VAWAAWTRKSWETTRQPTASTPPPRLYRDRQPRKEPRRRTALTRVDAVDLALLAVQRRLVDIDLVARAQTGEIGGKILLAKNGAVFALESVAALFIDRCRLSDLDDLVERVGPASDFGADIGWQIVDVRPEDRLQSRCRQLLPFEP